MIPGLWTTPDELCEAVCSRCGTELPVVYDLRRRQVTWLPWHKDPRGGYCYGDGQV